MQSGLRDTAAGTARAGAVDHLLRVARRRESAIGFEHPS